MVVGIPMDVALHMTEGELVAWVRDISAAIREAQGE